MSKPTFMDFEDWANSPEGCKAMNSGDKDNWPKCAICGATSNNESGIRCYWEPRCICDKFICHRHQAKYCGASCRAESRKIRKSNKK
eukprot:scaffold51211_cov57-Attheya_sp.AAC.1